MNKFSYKISYKENIDVSEYSLLNNISFSDNKFLDKVNFNVVVGGDGTLIKSIKTNSELGRINLFYLIKNGNLAYYACEESFNKKTTSNIKECIDSLDENSISKYDKYGVFSLNDSKLFVNDLVIYSSKMLNLKIKLDNKEFVVHSSGVIVSTKFGSSGIYNSFKNNLLFTDNKTLGVTFLGCMRSNYHGDGLNDFVIDTSLFKLNIEILNLNNECDIILDGNKLSYDDEYRKMSIKFVNSFYIINKFSKFEFLSKIIKKGD